MRIKRESRIAFEREARSRADSGGMASWDGSLKAASPDSQVGDSLFGEQSLAYATQFVHAFTPYMWPITDQLRTRLGMSIEHLRTLPRLTPLTSVVAPM